MSDPVVAAPGSAQQPQAVVAPAASAAAPIVSPAPVVHADDQNPAWLGARLDRERRTYLAGLGFNSEADATAARDAATAAANAKKTAEEREASRIAEVASLTARATALESTIAERATRELSGLTPEQRAAVERIAGTDTAAQLRAIDALAPTWGAKAPAPAAPIPAAGSSAPVVPAPPAPNPNPQANHLATYEDLQKRDPMSAGAYYLQHYDAISKAQSPRA